MEGKNDSSPGFHPSDVLRGEGVDFYSCSIGFFCHYVWAIGQRFDGIFILFIYLFIYLQCAIIV